MKYKNPKISRLNSIQDISLVPLASIFRDGSFGGGPGAQSRSRKIREIKTKRYFNPVRVPAEGEYKVHVVGLLRPIGYG